MERCICLIENNEDWLVTKVMEYVKNHSHEYTSLFDEVDFRRAIFNMSLLFVKVWQKGDLALDYLSHVNYAEDSIATLGKLNARNYMKRGMNSNMILCLNKLYRQSYIDLVLQAGWEPEYERRCHIQVLNFFDRIEFGICTVWADLQDELITTKKDLEQQVTELHKSREEIALINHQLKNIIDFLPDAALVTDKHKKIIAWNKAMEEMTGVSKKDIIGKGDYTYAVPFYGKSEPFLIDLLTSHDKQALKKYYLTEKQGEFLIAEGFIPAFNNGQGAYLRGKASLLYDNSGNYIGAIEIIHDITGPKKVEALLHREKEQLAVTLASIGDAVIAVDLDGFVTLINPVAENLTGYARSEATGQPLGKIFNILNEFTREPVENPVNRVMTEGKIVGLANHTALIAQDGTERSISDSAAPIIDVYGNIIGAILVFRDVTNERQREEVLRKSEERFRFLAENARDIIYRIQIYPEPKFEYVSPAVTRVTGYEPKEFYQDPRVIYQIVHPNDRNVLDDLYAGKYGLGLPLVARWFHKDGHLVWTEQHNTPLYDESGQLIAIEGIVRDITERKRAEEAITKSRDFYLTLFNDFPALIWQSGTDGKCNYFNKSWLGFTGRTMKQEVGDGWTAGVHPDDFNFCLETYLKAFQSRQPLEMEYRLRRYDGEYRWILDIARPFNDLEGNFAGYIGSCYDITDRQKAEENLKYITFHDALTSVYSRAYFEQEMRRMASGRFNPVGIVICDVDGLKLVNDTLGHSAGDKLLQTVAHLIQKAFRSNDVVARIGGDEFAVLLPNSDEAAVESACRRINNEISAYNSAHETMALSLSIGYAVSNETTVNMDELFKKADNNMYREKLHRRNSARSAIVNTLTKALEARDFITEGHAERLKGLVEDMAKAIGLSERQISDLLLLAQFHDIGKVGIPDSILFKNGPLTRAEFIEMQRHCEIGHRIAQSAPDLVPIADWILKHHERWDGNGYPLGLQGNEIPLECRILAIADAYDAMISDRPYRKAMSNAAAVKEIKNCAGAQFDPILVDKFIGIMQKNGNKEVT